MFFTDYNPDILLMVWLFLRILLFRVIILVSYNIVANGWYIVGEMHILILLNMIFLDFWYYRNGSYFNGI